MTEDPRLAPLAAALLACDKADHDPEHGPYPHACDSPEYWLDDAAAILAALPPDWCGHKADAEVFDEIVRLTAVIEEAQRRIDRWEERYARLRKIEEAARDRVKAQDACRALPEGSELLAAFAILDIADDRLRAALDGSEHG